MGRRWRIRWKRLFVFLASFVVLVGGAAMISTRLAEIVAVVLLLGLGVVAMRSRTARGGAPTDGWMGGFGGYGHGLDGGGFDAGDVGGGDGGGGDGGGGGE